MTKQKIGPMPLLWPHPTVLVGADVDGVPDFAAVAWTGVAASNPPQVNVSLQPHRHSLKGIFQNRTFSVNIPSVDLVKETDYCGLVSGKDTDKAADCGFEVFYGETAGAPMIMSFPMNLECNVRHLLDLGSHILVVGQIKEVHVSEDCLTEGRPDINKIKPFVFGPGRYFKIGEAFADAFRVGKTLKGGQS
jgi:flavin reductase (DIM6/NTAB) family NADH-FMN oxidoreductase RutF